MYIKVSLDKVFTIGDDLNIIHKFSNKKKIIY